MSLVGFSQKRAPASSFARTCVSKVSCLPISLSKIFDVCVGEQSASLEVAKYLGDSCNKARASAVVACAKLKVQCTDIYKCVNVYVYVHVDVAVLNPCVLLRMRKCTY
jgi:hypothetical protein